MSQAERTSTRGHGRNACLALAALALLVLGCGVPAVHAAGVRIVVQVDEPFEVDGTLYPAGRLSVRVLRAYTPSSTLNEIWVGDRRLGMTVTRERASESPATVDLAVFERGPQGHLRLIGYALRGQDSSQIFRFDRASRRAPAVAAAPASPAPTVLIASR